MLRRIAILLVLASASAECAPVPSRATITVNVQKSLGPVNPMIFGHNVEAADPFGIFDSEHRYSDTRNGEGFWDPVQHRSVQASVDVAKNVRMGILRYPGGCLVHGFRWKDAVGPVDSRPNFAFGIDEYLSLCRMIGCEPLMMISDYSSTPKEAAELVEYLNSPADDAHPWAKKRALWGHPKPYGVRYFEMGNESDHGNHDLLPKQRWTAAQYADWFEQGRVSMKAVDPTIQTGALMGTGTGVADSWNAIVLKQTKPDFVIVHTYPVNVWSEGKPATDPEDLIMRGCLAAIDQTELLLGQYRDLIKRTTGKPIPLAITEYNAGLVQEEPKPYRFSFGAALFSADYMGKLLKPQSGVLMANYWQILNGYWGMVQRGKVMPAYPLYKLWGRHTGTRLVASVVDGPRVTFEGYPGHVKPCSGTVYQPEAPYDVDKDVPSSCLKSSSSPNHSAELVPGGVRAKLDGVTGEQYPSLGMIPGQLGASYVVSFEARSSGLDGKTIGISVIDGRGWEPYHSGNAVEGLEGAHDWTRFQCRFDARPDCREIMLAWRFRPGAASASGTVEIRDLKVRMLRPETYPAYPALSTTATLSKDGKTLFLMVTNRDPKHAVDTTISLPGVKVATVRRWTVSASSLSALAVSTTESSGSLRQTFPAASMTALEIGLTGQR